MRFSFMPQAFITRASLIPSSCYILLDQGYWGRSLGGDLFGFVARLRDQEYGIKRLPVTPAVDFLVSFYSAFWRWVPICV